MNNTPQLKDKQMVKAKFMDHAAYVRRMRTLDVISLEFIIRDASEAAAVNPTGENCGYYLDEVNYAEMELNRRKQRAKVA